MSSTGSPEANASSTQVKRGVRACVRCRAGKARCVAPSGNPPQRCKNSNSVCVFETPMHAKAVDEDRIERMESTLNALSNNVERLMEAFGKQISSAGESPAGTTSSRITSEFGAVAPAFPPTLMPHPNNPALRLSAAWNAQSPSNPMAWPQDPNAPGVDPLASNTMSIPIPISNATLESGYPSNAAPAPPTFAHIPSSANPNKRNSDGLFEGEASTSQGPKNFPPLPGYRAPPHPISTYGIVPSRAHSEDGEDDALPSESLTAPFEALAQAAAEASGDMSTRATGSGHLTTLIHKGRPRKRPRTQVVPPPNAFPDVVEKGLVEDSTARDVFDVFMQNCLPFFPILDPDYDQYSSIRERTPWSLNSIIAVAATRMAHPTPAIRAAAEYGLEESQGIARSSLFGPTVRIEGCSSMAILAAWSEPGYLAGGHALRMAEELNLHRALEKLVDDSRERSLTEQRNLVISARIWLCLSLLNYTLCASSGRPLNLQHDLVSSDKLDAFLDHPFHVESDAWLVAQFELIEARVRIESMHVVSITSQIVEFARRTAKDLRVWHLKWDNILARNQLEEAVQRRRLQLSLNTTLLFLYTTLLKRQSLGSVESLPVDAREFAMLARQAASVILNVAALPSFRMAIRFATQDVFIEISFACLLYLKLSRLFPEGLDLYAVAKQCCDLYSWLREYQAQRFSLTIKIAVERFSASAGFANDISTLLNKLESSSSSGGATHSLATTLNAALNHAGGAMYGGGGGGGNNGNGYGNGPKSNGGEASNAPGLLGDLNGIPNSAFPGIWPNPGGPGSVNVLSLPVSDSNWVGSEVLPEWLQGDEDWTLDSAFNDGIDRLFLPQ
ncbi:BQ2448_5134 [Microbotryum intermedium]|uniref:BQ2448_5134 protein n=1 Tax=Microbotryum intermedium TaxID=269621 RepID=A0A238F698_9BASI|nr:BQ2448_5134 [Microbotryum intermedium]